MAPSLSLPDVDLQLVEATLMFQQGPKTTVEELKVKQKRKHLLNEDEALGSKIKKLREDLEGLEAARAILKEQLDSSPSDAVAMVTETSGADAGEVAQNQAEPEDDSQKHPPVSDVGGAEVSKEGTADDGRKVAPVSSTEGQMDARDSTGGSKAPEAEESSQSTK